MFFTVEERAVCFLVSIIGNAHNFVLIRNILKNIVDVFIRVLVDVISC